MAYAETASSSLGVTRKRSPILRGTWDGGSEASSTMMFRPGEMAECVFDRTSGTLQLQTAPVGTTNWVPLSVGGSNDITADINYKFVALGYCLLRMISTSAYAGIGSISRA